MEKYSFLVQSADLKVLLSVATNQMMQALKTEPLHLTDEAMSCDYLSLISCQFSRIHRLVTMPQMSKSS